MGKNLKISHLCFLLSLLLSLFLGDKVLGMLPQPPGDSVTTVGGSHEAKLPADANQRAEQEGVVKESPSLHRNKAVKVVLSRPFPGKPSPTTIHPRSMERVFIPTPDIFRGEVERKEISFTFDGGAGARETEEILAILRRHRIRTTIFLTGNFIEIFPRLVIQMVEDGHEIGNHTLTHPHLTTYNRNARHHTLPRIDREFIVNELRETAHLFQELTGEKMAPLWRAPYGEVNSQIRRWAFDAGYLHINWTRNYERRESLDSLDWVDDAGSNLYHTSEGIKRRILNFGSGGHGLKGGIVLMHLGTERTVDRAVDTLDETITALEERGYRFVKVSDLLQRRKGLATAMENLAQRRMVAELEAEKLENRAVRFPQ
ncbi:MAG: polysaccharide deacetylase family protein [Thermodesulfobacteriota bacterium]